MTDDLAGHWNSDPKSYKEAQSPGRLGDWHLVSNGVEETRGSEHTEMPQGHSGVWLDGDVEQANEEKHWDVLKVIQVVPVWRNASGHKCNRNGHNFIIICMY